MCAPGPKLECNCIPPGSSIATNIIFLLYGQPSKDKVERENIQPIAWESCIVVYLLYGNGFTLFSILSSKTSRDYSVSDKWRRGGSFVPNLKCLNPTLKFLQISSFPGNTFQQISWNDVKIVFSLTASGTVLNCWRCESAAAPRLLVKRWLHVSLSSAASICR